MHFIDEFGSGVMYGYTDDGDDWKFNHYAFLMGVGHCHRYSLGSKMVQGTSHRSFSTSDVPSMLQQQIGQVLIKYEYPNNWMINFLVLKLDD
jgi:hypothetical protein